MEECPPGGDCASGEGDPSKSDNPPASWTPNTTGEQTQGESERSQLGVSRGDDASQAASHSPQSKRKKDSSATSASQVLKKHEDEFFVVVNPKLNLLWLKRKEVISEGLISKIETADTRDAKEILFEHLHRNADVAALMEYCKMAMAADGFPRMQKLGEKMLNELALEGVPGVALPQSVSVEGSQTLSTMGASTVSTSALTCSSDLNDILHTYTTGIITCDMDIIHSQKEPEKAIKSLFFNTYSMLIRILRNCFDSIKASALDAALMQQVDATEEEVNQAQDLNALFRCLNINRNWNELHFLDVAIISLPPEESVKREAALLVLGQYKSYLRAYQKATAMKEGKSEFALLQRKQGRDERWVVTEVTVDKDITDYTYADCLELWKMFLIKALEIPEDRIEFRLARTGNSTTLVFMIVQTYAENTKEKLSKPAAVWVMKELGILRVYIAGVVSVDLREVLPNVLIASIREGLKSGVDCVSLTKVIPPLMRSLVDRVPEPKETQPGSIQPYSAVPAEQSAPEPVVEGASSASVVKDLLVAAAEGRLHEVQSLLDGGKCRVNDEDEEGFTAILKAALNGHLTVLRTLVEQYGGNAQHRKKGGRNAFHLCAERGHLPLAEYLAPKMEGHLFDSDDDGDTALHLASCFGLLSMVEYLVKSCGFDVKAIEKGGRNAFLLCAMGGHLAVAEYLAPKMVGHLFDSDDDGHTALHLAAYFGQLPMVEYLVASCGFDVKAIDKEGRTPLLLAAWKGHGGVARFLLHSRNTVQEEDNNGWTAVLLAARNGHQSLVQELCETFGADFLHRKKDGCNAFDACAVGGHLAIAEYLAPKMEGHLFDSDDDGYTALHCAAQEGQLSMVEYLVRSCGFDVKARDKWGYTPLLRAVVEGHADIARFLLASGSVFNERNSHGESALQIAVCEGHLDVVKVLVQVYRDCHMESEIGQSYMDLAYDYDHGHVVGYLSSEFPSLKRKVSVVSQPVSKVPVPQPRPTRYPNVWSISGPTYPDY